MSRCIATLHICFCRTCCLKYVCLTLTVCESASVILKVRITAVQMEHDQKSVSDRVARAEMYSSSLEQQAREQSTQLADARDRESQHRTTAAQMRSDVVHVFLRKAGHGGNAVSFLVIRRVQKTILQYRRRLGARRSACLSSQSRTWGMQWAFS